MTDHKDIKIEVDVGFGVIILAVIVLVALGVLG